MGLSKINNYIVTENSRKDKGKMRCNAVKIVESMRERVDNRFDASVLELNNLRETYHNEYDLICAAFVFGYAQGQKAERKRRKAV